MKRLAALLFLVISLSSCGLFLQTNGVKNYTLRDKITQKGLNKYQYDFSYLTRLLDEGFPEIDRIFPASERKLQTENTLKRLETTKNNIDFVIQVRKYLSKFKNQHTNILLNQEFNEVYPYVIYISYDNWYLLNLSKNQDSTNIGKKIISINGIPTTEVESRLIGFTFAENKINQQHEIRNLQLYNKPEYLHEIGVINDKKDKLTITFQDNTSIDVLPMSTKNKFIGFDILFKYNAMTKYQNETYFYKLYSEQNIGYLQFNKCHDKIDILDGIESYVKPWLQPVARGYVRSEFKKASPSKRITGLYNPKYPVFKDFVWQLVDSLNRNKIENLIIDLRNNPGGNLTLGIQLIYFLTEKDSLKTFSEFAYTSDIFKKYFQKEYQGIEKTYLKNVPQKKLVRTNPDNNLFSQITDKNSKYYIPANRPIFKGRVYVLSNYRTGSAAAMLTTLFQDNNIGTVIGTSVGNNPIGATTYTPMALPKTKAKISMATTYIIRPNKEKGNIQLPDSWIEFSMYDLMKGIDPCLTEVQKEISKNTKR